jgi:hypothetical protein
VWKEEKLRFFFAGPLLTWHTYRFQSTLPRSLPPLSPSLKPDEATKPWTSTAGILVPKFHRFSLPSRYLNRQVTPQNLSSQPRPLPLPLPQLTGKNQLSFPFLEISAEPEHCDLRRNFPLLVAASPDREVVSLVWILS